MSRRTHSNPGVKPAFLLDEEAQSVTAADGSRRYTVFDPVAVRIEVSCRDERVTQWMRGKACRVML